MAPGGGKESATNERKLAVRMKRDGKSTVEIARLLERSTRWVDRWWAKEQHAGPKSYQNKPGRGRKSKLTVSDKQKIQALMRNKVGRSHRKVAKVFEKDGNNIF